MMLLLSLFLVMNVYAMDSENQVLLTPGHLCSTSVHELKDYINDNDERKFSQFISNYKKLDADDREIVLSSLATEYKTHKLLSLSNTQFSKDCAARFSIISKQLGFWMGALALSFVAMTYSCIAYPHEGLCDAAAGGTATLATLGLPMIALTAFAKTPASAINHDVMYLYSELTSEGYMNGSKKVTIPEFFVPQDAE